MSELPRGWTRAKLGSVLELQYGKSLPEKSRKPGRFHVFGSNGPIGSHSEPLTSGTTIVVGRKGSIGEVHLSCEPCFPIDTTYYVDRFESVTPEFAVGLLRSLGLQDMDRASAIPGLNRNEVYALDVQIPPLPEQRRIVAKLHSLTGRTARAREELGRIPRLVQKYRENLIASALSGAWAGDWAKGGWTDCKARELFTWSSGKFLPKSKQASGRIPVYGGNGINGTHDRALVDRPTIVVGRVGAQCGNVYLTDGPAWITDNAIFAQTVSERVDPRFALLVLRHSNLNAESVAQVSHM